MIAIWVGNPFRSSAQDLSGMETLPRTGTRYLTFRNQRGLAHARMLSGHREPGMVPSNQRPLRLLLTFTLHMGCRWTFHHRRLVNEVNGTRRGVLENAAAGLYGKRTRYYQWRLPQSYSVKLSSVSALTA
jgi:hypothetical protein